MNILLTGGSGFIGKNIKEAMQEKYKILAPSHKDLNLIDEDQVDKYFSENNVDVVIHSAGKPGHRNYKDPTNIFYANTRMFFNLARNTTHCGKMIVIGSGAVYDQRYYTPKVVEEDYIKHIPSDEHGFSKYVCAKHIENMNNIVELRVFGVFGKYEDYAIRFISNAICKALFDLPITIKQNRKFDYIYVDDLIVILDHYINNKELYKSYNVTPDNSLELYQLAEIVREVSGKSELPILIKNPGMGLEYSGSNTRLRQEINNLVFTDMRNAISELYQWYYSNKNQINQDYLLVDK